MTTVGAARIRARMADRIPLVLLHGFPMTNVIWDKVSWGSPAHLRGFGPHPADGPFSIDDLADDVHQVIVELNGQQPDRRCALGGLSMGGYVALSVAERYPDDLSALVLFDTKATADDAATQARRDEMIDLAHTGGAAAIAAAMEPKLLSPSTPASVREKFRRMASGIAPQTLAWALAAMRDRPDRSAALARLAVPTLCVVGEDDAATPPAVVEDMRRQIPGADPLAVIPAAGHIPPMENPAEVFDVLRQFLGRLA